VGKQPVIKCRRNTKVTHVLGLVILRNGDTGLATESRDLNGGNLVVKETGLLGSLGLLVTANGVVILLGTVEAVVLGALLGSNTHKFLLAVGIHKTILLDTINQGLGAELGTAARSLQVVGSVGHGLSATGNNDIGVSGHDGLGTNDDSLQARGTDLVDSGTNGGFREASTDGALSGRVLSDTGNGLVNLNCYPGHRRLDLPSRQDVTEDDFLDIGSIDALSTLNGRCNLC
jgi:hypothetical protein